MRRLLTAMIVFVLAIVLVSPLVDAEDAVTHEQHHHAQAGLMVVLTISYKPLGVSSENLGPMSSSLLRQSFASMRC